MKAKIIKVFQKPPLGTTDEELKLIGKYLLEHPEQFKSKPKEKLHRCIDCRWCTWYDCLGKSYWECQKNQCDDLKTQSDRLLTNHMVVAKRKCKKFNKSE